MELLFFILATGLFGAYGGEWLAEQIEPYSSNTLFVLLLLLVGAFALGFA